MRIAAVNRLQRATGLACFLIRSRQCLAGRWFTGGDKIIDFNFEKLRKEAQYQHTGNEGDPVNWMPMQVDPERVLAMIDVIEAIEDDFKNGKITFFSWNKTGLALKKLEKYFK